MTIHHLVSTVIFGFCLLNVAIAEEASIPSNSIDYAHSNEEFSQCGIKKSDEELLAAAKPEQTKTPEISYVTGGICAEEVSFMKGIAQHFPLEIVFVQREQDKEVYLADIGVSLLNAKQEEVLFVVTEGPFLFVNLPDGKYTINATYRNVDQTKQVNVTKKHSRIVFLWEDNSVDHVTD